MPSVNAGPSNSATVNTQTPIVAAQANSPVSGGILVNQGATSLGQQLAPLVVAQTAVPVGIACTGTIGANGALTLGTALTAATPYVAGIYFNFPAGAVFSGSPAGFYLTKMSSTTVGTVFNNTYVAANGLPAIPAALVPVVDAGPGAYTGVTTLQAALQVTVPANILGNNGTLSTETLCSYLNSVGAKTIGMTWGGTAFVNMAPTTTASAFLIRNMTNRGVTNLQIGQAAGTGGVFGPGGGTVVSFPVDTTQSSTLLVNLTLATATDFLILEYFRAQAFYSA